jgi:hypothetical protein
MVPGKIISEPNELVAQMGPGSYHRSFVDAAAVCLEEVENLSVKIV